MQGQDPHMSLSERRTRRPIKPKPKHYNDILPTPPPSLQPQPLPLVENPSTRPALILKYFQSPRSIFGLRRKYYATESPVHDPEELVTLDDLSSAQPTVPGAVPTPDKDGYLPYPNRSSFLLGDWYWSDGVQKSKQSFKRLLDIVGEPSFSPSDVRNTPWNTIDTTLGSSEKDESHDGEWLDADAGWTRTPIKISVPFHSHTSNPGAKDYVGGHLYHRSLVEIIKERISDFTAAQRFHFQPYQLSWSPHPSSYEIPVYGELYTSPSFLKAHHILQNTPQEPGCSLQRVVVALMFWSDATHLTSFGSAKLWPLYLFFGNESKYRRCRPNCNLCCHTAYFEDVS